MRLLSAQESRQLDRLSHDPHGVSFWDLMANAGWGVAKAVLQRWPELKTAPHGMLVVLGRGNNGGDGLVAARHLKERGVDLRVVMLGQIAALQGPAARAFAEFAAAGGTVQEIDDEAALARAMDRRPDCIIDAIFGTGLNAPIGGLAAAAVEAINRFDTRVVAVDIASGINADTGAVMGVAVKATLTVTFGLAKYGHVSYPGAGYTGALRVIDIGFPPAVVEQVNPLGRFVEAAEVRPLLPPRPPESHKGTYGHPLIVAGASGRSGAALLASRAALRTGAGLVTAAVPRCVSLVVAAGQAELMTEPMPDSDGHFMAARTIECLRRLLPNMTALVVGPGIGVSEDSKALMEFFLTEAAAADRPLLIDADGLNCLSQMGLESVRRAHGAVVLTPHPGEMGRLLQSSAAEVNADRISAVRRLAQMTGAYCLVKGNRTVLADAAGRVRINSSGNPGMASPGMGDALSGIIGALLACAMDSLDAMSAGVFMHGAAADRLAKRVGPVGFLAGDVINELPAVRAALV